MKAGAASPKAKYASLPNTFWWNSSRPASRSASLLEHLPANWSNSGLRDQPSPGIVGRQHGILDIAQVDRRLSDHRVLEITTSSTCSVACDYCPQDALKLTLQRLGAPSRLTFATFTECLSTVPGSVRISFSGFVEPWMNRECTRMVLHAAAKGHPIRVFSTLVGMSLDDVHALSKISFEVFVVHLPDGGGRMPGAIPNKRYLSVLRAIQESGIENLKFMCFGELDRQLSAILAQSNVNTAKVLISRAGNVDERIVRAPQSIASPLTCSEGREYRNVLLPDGSVVLCCMDYRGEHKLGNLLVQPYESLHRGAEFLLIRSRMMGSQGSLLCRRCELAKTASGADR